MTTDFGNTMFTSYFVKAVPVDWWGATNRLVYV